MKMLYRCVACTRDHYSQPAACENCGLTSFAVIHLTPVCAWSYGCKNTPEAGAEFCSEHLWLVRPVVVEASPGMPAELQDEVAAAFDEAPPTPRDMPDQGADDSASEPVSDGDDGEAVGEDLQVAMLRPVVVKAAGVCSQTTCDAPATHRFTWPGHPEAISCHEHALKAVLLAEHMGFFLEAPAL